MSDATSPDDVPSTDHLDKHAQPATYRRAPNVMRIVQSGVVLGLVLGFVAAMILPNNTGIGRFMVGVLLAVGFALLTGLIAGAIAVGLDARSVRKHRGPDAPR